MLQTGTARPILKREGAGANSIILLKCEGTVGGGGGVARAAKCVRCH